MLLRLYRFLTARGASLWAARHLQKRVLQGKEIELRVPERFGSASRVRPKGFLMWIHAASVGESASILPLIQHFLSQYPDSYVLLTTATVSAARVLENVLPPRTIHQFIPLDIPKGVNAFLDHWSPDLAIWVESEFWPNIMQETHERGIPMVLINGRISARSRKRWRFARGVLKTLLQNFDLILTQSLEGAEFFKKLLPSTRVVATGNVKFAATDLPVDEKMLALIRREIGIRPLWLAASTHPGEEELIAAAHLKMQKHDPDVLTIIVPRHPERGCDIARMLRKQKLNVAQRSLKEPLTDACQIYVADTFSELGLWFRLSSIVFLGGSLVPIGGHNIIEPARLGCAILVGPYMNAQTEIMGIFNFYRGVTEIHNAEDLAAQVHYLLDQPTALRRAIHHASDAAYSQTRVLDIVWEELTPFFDKNVVHLTQAL